MRERQNDKPERKRASQRVRELIRKPFENDRALVWVSDVVKLADELEQEEKEQ